METTIDTGDHVHHGPSNENWVVAYAHGEYLAWCGWPEGEAKLSDCTLIRKATPEERIKLLNELAAMNRVNDARACHARYVLSQEGEELA